MNAITSSISVSQFKLSQTLNAIPILCTTFGSLLSRLVSFDLWHRILILLMSDINLGVQGIAVATKAQFDSTDLALLELAWIQLIQENKPITKKELAELEYELQHYKLDVPCHPQLKILSIIAELCQGLVKIEKSGIYPFINRLLRLILTLSVSIATTECAISALKIIKSRLRSKMEDDFLKDLMIVYIEKQIAEGFTTNTIIDDFYFLKQRRVQLKK
ncbi:zinc finger MYM-type protein 1-like [Senna tora]|uniref:Zinc finger MYM-type protein 1-like n=1 Tax=Senna tora TaxID=362788 RepID=A0A834TNV5_9FABA|nr:zinc finger MYM-type protein 1-like [Senna tora]